MLPLRPMSLKTGLHDASTYTHHTYTHLHLHTPTPTHTYTYTHLGWTQFKIGSKIPIRDLCWFHLKTIRECILTVFENFYRAVSAWRHQLLTRDVIVGKKYFIVRTASLSWFRITLETGSENVVIGRNCGFSVVTWPNSGYMWRHPTWLRKLILA